MDVALENYWRLPPLSRTFATVACVMSVGVLLGMVPMQYIIYHPMFLFRFPPQLWRLLTSFLVTSQGLGLLFDTYFLYSYLSQMEVGNPRFPRKEDLIWYLIFVSGTILCYASTSVTVPGNEEEYPHISVQSIIRKSGLFCGVGMVANHITGFGFMIFLPALILSMAYTVTQDQRGAKVNYMFVSMPAQLMPYAMIGMNLLFPGGAMNMLLQLQGLFAGHLFDFLSRTWPTYGGGRNLIPTPRLLSRLVQRADSFVQARFGAMGNARPAGRTTGGSAGSSGGPLPDSWRTRGPGQRLG